MIWLILSVLCSTLIFLIFKYFAKFGVNNLQAIVVNYVVAFTVGMASSGFAFNPLHVHKHNWFISVLVLSFLFISIFQVMAYVSQKIGVSVVSVASKMSLIVPVSFGVVFYGEGLGLLKIIGILLALPAVYFTTLKKEKIKKSATNLWIPIMLFLASGFLDTYLKYNQEKLVPEHHQSWFTSSIFAGAALLGFIWIGVLLVNGKTKLEWKNLWAGIILGIPNYGSIYFLLKALGHEGNESSFIFPVNNVAIVALSVISALLIFGEKLSKMNIVGILLAIVSILLINMDRF